jgi:hypothetical protein
MSNSDERPRVAIGHVILGSPDVGASTEFLLRAGLRMIEAGETVSVLELRGGTHLIVVPSGAPVAGGAKAGFDLMVDDIEATHKIYAELELDPSNLEPGEFHTSFKIVEPGGHEITVNSSHASDLPV